MNKRKLYSFRLKTKENHMQVWDHKYYVKTFFQVENYLWQEVSLFYN